VAELLFPKLTLRDWDRDGVFAEAPRGEIMGNAAYPTRA
jgi:hypothetical protein